MEAQLVLKANKMRRENRWSLAVSSINGCHSAALKYTVAATCDVNRVWTWLYDPIFCITLRQRRDLGLGTSTKIWPLMESDKIYSLWQPFRGSFDIWVYYIICTTPKLRRHGWWILRPCGSLVLNNFTTLDQLWRTNQRWWSYRNQWCHCPKRIGSSSHSRPRSATAEIHKGYGLWAQREFGGYRVVQMNEEIDQKFLKSVTVLIQIE